MKKKILSLLVVISLICSYIPAINGLAYAADELTVSEEVYRGNSEKTLFQAEVSETETIRVRVEGLKSTLFNREILFTAEMDDPLDVLKAAVGEDNIEGSDSSYGYYITEILGESGSSNSGWSYYVELKDGTIVQPMVAVDKYEGLVEDGKLTCRELVFYMTSYSGANILTKIPKVTVEPSGNKYTVKVINYKDESKPLNNVDVYTTYVGEFKTDDLGEVVFNLDDKGIYNIYISKDGEFPGIVRKHILLTHDIDEESVSELVYAVNELVDYYKDEKLSSTAVMAYNSAIDNILDYKDAYKPETDSSAKAYAQNIMGLIATGQDPTDYVEELVREQNDGLFSEDPVVQAMAIIALDMAGADYEKTKAIQELMAMAQDGHYDGVIETANVMIALSKHTGIDGVDELLSTCAEYLKMKQLDNGGFDYSDMGNSPYAVAPVIHALVANKINPLSDEWTRNGSTLLDALLACRLGDGTFKSAEKEEDNTTDSKATQYAFAALVDLYRGISIYDKYVLNGQEKEDKSDYEKIIETIDGLRDYFTSIDERYDSSWQIQPAFYTPLEALALNVTSDDIQRDIEDIAEKVKLNETEGTLPYALNIIGMISSGQDPKEYVDSLVAAQKDDGSFQLGKVEQTEWAVIALDMAKAEYDVKKAVNYIMNENEDQSSIDLLAVALTALAPHKDIEGVEEFIDVKLDYINSNQLESGGFKDSLGSENSLTTSYVISALVANGIDPLTDERWIKNDKNLLDVLLEYKTLNYFIYSEEYGEYMYKDEATAQAFIALSDLLHKKSTYQNVKKVDKIKEAIDSLRSYYLKSNDDFTFRVALGYHHTSDNLEEDLEIIAQRYKANSPTSASACAGNIMGLIAAGKNPRDFNGEDYVKILVESQNEQGKFIIGQYGDYPTTVAFSILALDMANADYDVEGAVKALLSYQNTEGSFGSVDDTAMSIMALGNHREIEGVNDAITKGLANLKENQLPSGGFEAWGEENPYSVSAVIQSLIALGEDPLSEEWIKNGNTMLDALLSFRVDDHFENPSQWGTETVMATEQAFLALADLYRGKSMFTEIGIKDNVPSKVEIQEPSSNIIREKGKLKLSANIYNTKGEILIGHNLIWESSDEEIARVDDDGLVTAIKAGTVTVTVKVKGYEDVLDTIELTVKPEEFKVTRIGAEKIKNGSEAKLEFLIQNKGEEPKSATLIVVLYDKDTNKMINYSFTAKTFEVEETANLGAGFLVPDEGEYIIKCFVWESFENQDIILANPIEIEVVQ